MVSVIDCLPGDARRAPAAIIMRAIWDGTVTRSNGRSVIDCLPEERGRDLTAGLARIRRLALLAPVRADRPGGVQRDRDPGEESLSDVVDAARDREGQVRVRDHVGDRVSRIIQPCGYRGSRVTHRFVLSLSLPMAARSRVMRSQVVAGDRGRPPTIAA